MNRDRPPTEEEQFDSLAAIVDGMNGQEVTIRTLDIGGDKLTFPLGGLLRESPNPALGLRAVRLGLRHREILETQLAAILRVAAIGRVRVLLPMISNLAQVREIRAMMTQLRESLVLRGARVGPRPPAAARHHDRGAGRRTGRPMPSPPRPISSRSGPTI